MKINLLASLAPLLLAGVCLGQGDDGCPDTTQSCCLSGVDNVCCADGLWHCDCVQGGGNECQAPLVCVDGCCVGAGQCQHSLAGNPCDPDDDCVDYETCCPHNLTCDTASGCCVQSSQCPGSRPCYIGASNACGDWGYCSHETGCCVANSGVCYYQTCDPALTSEPSGYGNPDCDGTPFETACVNGCCVDPNRCGVGVTSCEYGGGACGGGTLCDSNGCCTLPCAQCDVGTFVAYTYTVADPHTGLEETKDCCERTVECATGCLPGAEPDVCAPWGQVCEPWYGGYCCGCVPEYSGFGVGCGPCGWGTLQCDGSCSDPNPPCQCDSDSGCECDAGTSCGNCGTWTCAGGCYDPCPNPPGGSCGGCGTYDSTGTYCDDPCDGCATIYTNYSCGNCGYIECNGDCYDPCTCSSQAGGQCGSCGYINCDGSCGDPCAGCSSQLGQGCGNCGTYQCDGSCNDPCACGGGNPGPGSSCGVCGVVQSDCTCDDSCS
jgi:hypothetical protein